MTENSALSNREIAAVFFNIATLLKADPTANPYRIAAYQRAGQALMGLRREAREILDRKPQITFRRDQHIGKRLHAKIGEMVSSGKLDQFTELLETAPAPVRDLVSNVPGMGPILAARVHIGLGIEDRDALVRSARSGRLRTVKGFGAGRVARIAALPLSGEPTQLALPL